MVGRQPITSLRGTRLAEAKKWLLATGWLLRPLLRGRGTTAAIRPATKRKPGAPARGAGTVSEKKRAVLSDGWFLHATRDGSSGRFIRSERVFTGSGRLRTVLAKPRQLSSHTRAGQPDSELIAL